MTDKLKGIIIKKALWLSYYIILDIIMYINQPCCIVLDINITIFLCELNISYNIILKAA